VVANGVGCISELARNTATKKKRTKKKGEKGGLTYLDSRKKSVIVLACAADTDLRRVVWGVPQVRMSSALCILCMVGYCYMWLVEALQLSLK